MKKEGGGGREKKNGTKQKGGGMTSPNKIQKPAKKKWRQIQVLKMLLSQASPRNDLLESVQNLLVQYTTCNKR